MKIQILSDCHFEFWDSLKSIYEFIDKETTDCNVLILAGDIIKIKHEQNLWPYAIFKKFSENFKNVVYIPGNHEFYFYNIEDGTKFLSETISMFSNIYLLQDYSKLVFGDYNIVGNTLWFPKREGDEQVKKYINDFRLIEDIESAGDLNTNTRRALMETINENSIVVTHHLPTWDCVNPKYLGDKLNRFFVGDSDDFIKSMIIEKIPIIWVYGHDHCSSSRKIGHTQVISNQYGYKFQGEKSGYQSKFTIEV